MNDCLRRGTGAAAAAAAGLARPKSDFLGAGAGGAGAGLDRPKSDLEKGRSVSAAARTPAGASRRSPAARSRSTPVLHRRAPPPPTHFLAGRGRRRRGRFAAKEGGRRLRGGRPHRGNVRGGAATAAVAMRAGRRLWAVRCDVGDRLPATLCPYPHSASRHGLLPARRPPHHHRCLWRRAPGAPRGGGARARVWLSLCGHPGPPRRRCGQVGVRRAEWGGGGRAGRRGGANCHAGGPVARPAPPSLQRRPRRDRLPLRPPRRRTPHHGGLVRPL